MLLAMRSSRWGLRNSTTRIPFRYGKACLTRCPQVVVGATIVAEGREQEGFSGDCLPPGWFDKSPAKDFRTQIDEMRGVIELSRGIYAEEFARATLLFPAWLRAHHRIHQRCAQLGWTPLLASFGSSLLERALIDALCRAAGVPFAAAVRDNLLGIEPGVVHPSLAGLEPRDWLPDEPRRSVFVRHTIGLGDPLTAADASNEERLDDGFPQSLEDYVVRCGLRYFKVKVANDLPRDLARLREIARIVENVRGDDYRLTLDGNEQYRDPREFDALIAGIQREPALATLWNNLLVIEQPLERAVALQAAHGRGLRELSRTKPVIIDESDGDLHAYARAIDVGYRGVSSKNCKGTIKSLLNAGLTWLHNDRGSRSDFVMTGEDLCSVGVIPVQADLCLVATLGLTHVERNGHHYHPGLSYLPITQQETALAAHADFYAASHGIIAPRLVDGRFEIGSLQCVGFGFDCEPDFGDYEAPDAWTFDSLGL